MLNDSGGRAGVSACTYPECIAGTAEAPGPAQPDAA
jgi:hypothetical protein